MARTIDEIQASMITDVQSDSTLSGLTSTSKRAIWRLWTYVFAVAVNLLEQLMDVFKTDNETIVSLAPPQTTAWLSDKIFKFQYDATNPQVLQLINLVPQYPVVDVTKRIVTRVSVKTNLAGQVFIKVAKGSTPQALSSDELNSLSSYTNQIGVTGLYYTLTSTNSDKLMVAAQVYYNGSYSAVIQANVIAGINAFLAALPFDGSMQLSDLEAAIRNVEGVNDLILNNVVARQDSVLLANGTYLVQSNQYISRKWNTVSGYIVPETTTSFTLADTLTFIPE
jgi:hypothetical protein